jgi:hypothetical protein
MQVMGVDNWPIYNANFTGTTNTKKVSAMKTTAKKQHTNAYCSKKRLS